jgi:NAD(P)-dependent dehydrogenase (short-subunit alcohol dehydrogenase family)
MSRLKDKTAIVTGAASGIGQAIAQRFVKEGARVLFTDIDRTKVENVIQELDSSNAESSKLDVTQAGDFKKALDYVNNEWGQLDILINNAGYGVAAQAPETSEDEWQKVIDICMKGTFLGMKQAIPVMQDQGKGAIINMASVAALVGVADRAAYCAAKGGVMALTRASAVDHAREGIRINCIAPGTVDTPWVERITQDYDDPQAARQAMNDRQPHGRLVSPEEVASMAVYLASDEAASTNGSVMVVDGGWTAQ